MTSKKPQHQQAKSTNSSSKRQAHKLNPEQIPWFDDGYTFSDRERELALLDDLLSARLADVRFQRQVIRQQIVTGDFGIPFTEDAATEVATKDAVGPATCVACANQPGKE